MNGGTREAGAVRDTVRGVARECARVALTLLAATAVMLIVLAAMRYDPRVLAPAFARGAFGGGYRVAATALLACPLCVLGVAVAVAFRGGVLNIGAEGQYLAGAAAAAAIGPHLGGWPASAAVPLLLVCGAAAGAAWAAVAGALRIRRGVQEVLSTILLNFIALRGVEFLVRGPLVDPASIDRDSTAAIADSAALWQLWPAGGLHAGVVVALVVVAGVQLMLSRMSIGFRIDAVGAGPPAAEHAGISPARVIMRLFALSGGLAGLAGAIEIAGTQRYLTSGFAAGYGYTAIAVALFARLTPWAIVPSALFFAAIDAGARGMQKLADPGAAEFPTAMKFVAQGVVVLLTLAFIRPKRER